MGRILAIQEGNNDFVQSVNIVVGANASKTFGIQILQQPANKLVLLNESKDENNIDQQNRTQDKISWGEECVDGKLYEWTL